MGTRKMILLIAGIVLVMAALGCGIWYFTLSRTCNPPLPRKTIAVGSQQFDVEMATTIAERACGLSGRTGLADNQGMLFTFGFGSTQSFWMKDMNFALDMIWISGGKVVGIAENAAPQPGVSLWQLKIYTSPPNVDTVLEVNAGTATRDGIQIGDIVNGV